MPKKYYKKYSKKYSKRYNNYSRGLGQLYKDVVMLKHLINVEKKFIDTQSAGTTFAASTTGTVVPISLVGQGTADNQRIGDSIKYASIEVEGFVQLNASATSDYAHVSLVLDRQVNASLPAYSNIYAITTAPACLSPRNASTVDRYVVLKDWTIDLDSNGQQIMKFKHYQKCPLGQDFHEKFNNTSNTISDVYSNALYLCFSGNLTTNLTTINYACRVRFIDN